MIFTKLECVCLPTADMRASIEFYTSMGLMESWRIERTSRAGIPWSLVGLRFPDQNSSDLVLSDDPDNRRSEVELAVADVRQAYAELSANPEVAWVRTPFEIESGHVAVMKAPDGNLFVLVGS
jgi:catechol 2,3-dioxygenase-like lactoylglutathione lyase family enzyme